MTKDETMKNERDNAKWQREAAELLSRSVCQSDPIYYRSIECGFVGQLVGFQEHNGRILRMLAGVNAFDQSIEHDEIRCFDRTDLEQCTIESVSSSIL